jgi:hypothetical protein
VSLLASIGTCSVASWIESLWIHACSTRDSLHKTLLNSLNKSEGSQRASRGGESFVVRVNSYRSILNAYNAGREAEIFLSSLNRSEGSQRVLCEVRVLSSALTTIVASLTRTTPLKRPFRFILVFADDTHAHHQLLNTGYHEKVWIHYLTGLPSAGPRITCLWWALPLNLICWL